jgi:hypothetical protein
MSIPDDLLNIRDHLRSGRFGQREVWEQQLEEAAAEVEHLQYRLLEVDAELTAESHIHAQECMALRAEKDAEIERLHTEIEVRKAAAEKVYLEQVAEIERLKADKAKMQILLNEARGPDGHTHERVAEWLREQGYTVTKNEPEFR